MKGGGVQQLVVAMAGMAKLAQQHAAEGAGRLS